MGTGIHVGFPISAKDKHLVYDHPMNIISKIVFSDPDLGSKWPPSADIVLT
jgi:hypothetical protein